MVHEVRCFMLVRGPTPSPVGPLARLPSIEAHAVTRPLTLVATNPRRKIFDFPRQLINHTDRLRHPVTAGKQSERIAMISIRIASGVDSVATRFIGLPA